MSRKQIAFLFGFGLLPFGVSIVFGFMMGQIAVPYVLITGLWYSKFTIVFAVATLLTYHWIPGGSARKYVVAKRVFFAIIAICLIYSIYWIMQQKSSHIDYLQEERDIRSFVKSNEEVLKAVGRYVEITAPDGAMSKSPDKVPSRYEVPVTDKEGNTSYVIVKVVRTKTDKVFSVRCITQLSSGYRDASKDACHQ